MNEDEWTWMNMNGNEWRWMNMNENEWTWLKMNEDEWTWMKIRPHRRCWGVIVRMALVKGYRFTLGGPIFRPKPPVFDRSWRSPSKNTVKNSTEDTCSWTRPSKIGKRKVKKTRVFQLFDLNFLVCNIFFLQFRRWPGPEADFWVFGPVFGLIFVVLW